MQTATPPRNLPIGAGHNVLRRLLRLFHPYRRRVLIAFFFIALNALSVTSMPLFTRHVLDVAIPQRDARLAIVTMSIFLATMGVRIWTWYIAQVSLLYIREKVIFTLRSAVFARLQELCLRFHSRYTPGYLYDRTLGNASLAVGTFLQMVFNSVVLSIMQLVFALAIGLQLHVGLTLLVLTMSSTYIFVSRFFRGKIRALTSAYNRQANEFAGQTVDLLRGVKTIKAFSMEERIVSEFDEQLWPLQLRSLDVNKATMLLGFVNEAIGFIVQAVIVVAGGMLVIQGQITLGTLVAFISYQTMLIGMLSLLSTSAGTYGAAQAGLEQMYEVIDERPSVIEKPNAVMPTTVEGGITLEDVHFAYDETPVIRGMRVHIPAGQSVALVGPSGGGKSTLVNLLMRFYDPDRGVIRLDGVDIRDLPLAGYRGQFGVVLQDPFLFNDTIRNNLLAVRPEATDDELRAALERAQAWEFVSTLKDGWEYQVGENGTQLSGGQRQRIALARCFLTKPRIMVLDEATSALDTKSESLVQHSMEELARDCTMIVIAHRLSTVQHVDRVLVVQDGAIAQDGNFAELSRADGLFRELLHGSLLTTTE